MLKPPWTCTWSLRFFKGCFPFVQFPARIAKKFKFVEHSGGNFSHQPIFHKWKTALIQIKFILTFAKPRFDYFHRHHYICSLKNFATDQNSFCLQFSQPFTTFYSSEKNTYYSALTTIIFCIDPLTFRNCVGPFEDISETRNF